MILEYNYWYFISELSSEVCDAILEYGINAMVDQERRLGESSTNGWTGDNRQRDVALLGNTDNMAPLGASSWNAAKKKGLKTENLYVRDSKVVFIEPKWLYELVWPYIKIANTHANWNFHWDFTEPFQFTKYTKGQFYGWHADSSALPYALFDETKDEILRKENGEPYTDSNGDFIPIQGNLTTHPNYIGKIRKLSVTISLSDPSTYKGGNLRFDFGPHAEKQRFYTCKEIRPKGSIIVFPSHLYHQVTPVTLGTRYSLVCWNLGAPFK